MTRTTTCRWCPAEIILGRTENAKTMPLNPRPDPAGNVAVHKDHMGNLHCRVLRKNEQPAAYEDVYVPHWATCLNPPRRKPATPPIITTPH